MFAELRIGDISHPPLSSCGRVIGEPWKSKILMKGLPDTYRTWSREMCVIIRWVKMLAQSQFLVKNSDPPSNSDTRGRRNSQNKWNANGRKLMSTEVISLACCHYMCQHSHNRDPQACSTCNVDEIGWGANSFCQKDSKRNQTVTTFSKSSRLDSKSKGISV